MLEQIAALILGLFVAVFIGSLFVWAASAFVGAVIFALLEHCAKSRPRNPESDRNRNRRCVVRITPPAFETFDACSSGTRTTFLCATGSASV